MTHDSLHYINSLTLQVCKMIFLHVAFCRHCDLVDGSRMSSVEGSVCGQDQAQKDSKTFPMTQKPTLSSGSTLQRKVSDGNDDDDDDDDDEDASDSEKMVICEDEPAGNDIHCY